MLDRLPPELLSPILRLAFPLEYAPYEYRLRNRKLKALCLSSRRMRAVAQPLLGEVMEAMPRTFSFLKQEKEKGGEGLTDVVKVLSVAEVSYTEEARMLEGEETSMAVSACPNVEDLRIYSSYEFDLACLGTIRNLRSLVLAEVTLTALAVPTIPSLVELTIFSCDTTEDFLSHFLDVAFLPSLRALALAENIGPHGWLVNALFDDDFLSNLDIIVTTTHRRYYDHMPTVTIVNEVELEDVYEVLHPTPFPSGPVHLRILRWNDFVPSRPTMFSMSEITCTQPYMNLCALQSKLNDAEESSILSLDLPEDQHPDAQQYSPLCHIMSDIVEVCEAKGIKVFWTSRDVSQSRIPRETWATAKEARAEMEVKLGELTKQQRSYVVEPVVV